MIVDERIRDYICSLEPEAESLRGSIAGEARRQGIPVMRQETESLLKTLVAARQPGAILEVGTAVGYSALLMAQVMPAWGRITTIEKYRPHMEAAVKNFKEAREERINLIFGDAEEVLQELSGPYDFIFMDGAKGQYLHWLPRILELLGEGGILLSDNVLQEGTIVQSRFAVERRDRTIHSRMREYLYTLKHTQGLETAIVPVGDGVAISVKRDTGRKKP